mgnify:CR=1 FL=1
MKGKIIHFLAVIENKKFYTYSYLDKSICEIEISTKKEVIVELEDIGFAREIKLKKIDIFFNLFNIIITLFAIYMTLILI